MKILVDVNVIMDVTTRRAPFHTAAAIVWAAVEQKRVDGVVCAITLPTMFYLTRKLFGNTQALAGIIEVRKIFSVSAVDERVIDATISSGMPDFEDAVQLYSGLSIGITHVVTRDQRGFSNAPVPVMPPEQLPFMLQSKP